MGLDGLQFDAVKKFNASMEQSNKEMRQQMEAKNITVPIVAQQPKDLDMGVKIQADPENKEEKTVIKATGDGQGAVEKTTVEQDDADPNVNAQKEEVQKDEAQEDIKVADKTKQTAVEEAAAQRAENQKAEQAKTGDKAAEQNKKAETLEDRLVPERKLKDVDSKKYAENNFKDFKFDSEGRLIRDDKAAKAAAKDYIENEKRNEEIAGTVTCFSEIEENYKKALTKFDKETLVAQYKKEGLSKKEANKKAEAVLPKYERLKNKEALAYVNNLAEIKDENGKISQKLYKDYLMKELNDFEGTDESKGEANINYLRLAARRGLATKWGISDDAVCDMYHRAGFGWERDYTEVMQYGADLAIIGASGGIGAATKSTIILEGVAAAAGASTGAGAATSASSSGANAASGAYVKEGDVIVSRNHFAKGAAIGSTAVAVIEALNLWDKIGFYDHGKAKKVIYKPTVKEVQQGKVSNLNLHLNVPQPNLKPTVTLPEVKPCPEDEWIEDDCKPEVIPGSSWAYFAEKAVKVNNKKITGTKYYEPYLYAQQLMYKIPDPKGLKENRFLPIGSKYQQYSDFGRLFADEEIMKKFPQLNVLKDVEIEIDCNALKDTKVRGKKPRGFRYGGHITNAPYAPTRFTQSCNDNVPVPHYD